MSPIPAIVPSARRARHAGDEDKPALRLDRRGVREHDRRGWRSLSERICCLAMHYPPRRAVCYTTGTDEQALPAALCCPGGRAVAALRRHRPAAESLQGWGLPDDVEGLRAFCERMVEACARWSRSSNRKRRFRAARAGRNGNPAADGRGGPEPRRAGDHRRQAGTFRRRRCGLCRCLPRAAQQPVRRRCDDAERLSRPRIADTVFEVAPARGGGGLRGGPVVQPGRIGLQQARLPDGRSVAEHLAGPDHAPATRPRSRTGLGLYRRRRRATSEPGGRRPRRAPAKFAAAGSRHRRAMGATIVDMCRPISGGIILRSSQSISRGIARAGPAAADFETRRRAATSRRSARRGIAMRLSVRPAAGTPEIAAPCPLCCRSGCGAICASVGAINWRRCVGNGRRGNAAGGYGMPRKWVSAVFVAGSAAAFGFAAPAQAGPTVEKIKQAGAA